MNTESAFIRPFLLSSLLAFAVGSARALNVGDPAPPFSHPEADGGTISLAEQAGKVVLLNFWASWCGPCKEEIPEIETDIQQIYGPDSFTAIGLNKFDDLETIGLYKHVLLGLDISYPFGHDEFGATSAAYEAASVLPYNYLIDQTGIVQYKEFGFSKEAIIATIEELLGAEPLVVHFSSDDPVVDLGSPVVVDYSIENTGVQIETVTTRVNLTLEDGEPYAKNPLIGPIPMTLGPGGEFAGSRKLPLPTDVGVGVLTLCLDIGDHDDEPRISDCFDVAVEGPVLLAFTTPNPNVRRGEFLSLDYQVINESEADIAFEAWVENYEIGGGGDPRNPVFGPAHLKLEGGRQRAGSSRYPLPPSVKIGGPYRLCLLAGAFPDMVWDSSCVDYYVVP